MIAVHPHGGATGPDWSQSEAKLPEVNGGYVKRFIQQTESTRR